MKRMTKTEKPEVERRKMAKRQGIKSDEVECLDGFRFVRALVFKQGRTYETPSGPKMSKDRWKPKRYWHITKRGTPISLMVWQAKCAKCGDAFEVRIRWLDTEAAGVFKLRHCENHRLTLAQCTVRAAILKNVRSATLKAEVLGLLGQGHGVRAVVLATGCPIATVYRWQREALQSVVEK